MKSLSHAMSSITLIYDQQYHCIILPGAHMGRDVEHLQINCCTASSTDRTRAPFSYRNWWDRHTPRCQIVHNQRSTTTTAKPLVKHCLHWPINIETQKAFSKRYHPNCFEHLCSGSFIMLISNCWYSQVAIEKGLKTCSSTNVKSCSLQTCSLISYVPWNKLGKQSKYSGTCIKCRY